jgi:pilus assembly protein CpaB
MATLSCPVPCHGVNPAALLGAVFRTALRGGRPAGPRPNAGRPPRTRKQGSRPPRRRLAGWLNRNRRLAVALLLCVAASLAVQQLTPAPAATVTALAAVSDLPAGKTLAREDVLSLDVPPGLVPGGSFSDRAAVQGKQLAVALRKGQLLSDSQLLGPGLLAGSPPGSAAVPLRLADPASIQLVSPGQLVNIVMTSGSGFEQPGASQVLAAAVPVLWTSGQGGKAGQWLATGEAEGLIVVAADPDQALRLAGASTLGKLFFVLVGTTPG